jgi:hypothetical protein
MTKEKLVKTLLENQEQMNALTVDKVAELAPAPVETVDVKALMREKAKQEGALFLEPKRKLQSVGKLAEKDRKMHAHDWEYVCGIFQPEVTGSRPSTEPYEFWFAKWPGDPDCLWSIPVNRKVYVPRMIALHLSGEKETFTGIETMKYHTFDYLQKPESHWRPDDFTHQFSPITTIYRGRFIAAGAF